MSGLPFVVFGNPNSIEFLRNVGFDCLDDLIDHSYDKISDPAERFEAAWQECLRLFALGQLVEDNMDRLREASRHNLRIFKTNLPEVLFYQACDELSEFLAQ